MAISQDSLSEKMTSLEIDEASRERALARLKVWKKDDGSIELSDANIRKYCALALLKGGGRISKKLFTDFKTQVAQTTTVGVSYWMQWRSKFPQLPEGLLAINPKSIPNFPRGIRAEDVGVVDGKARTGTDLEIASCI